MSKLRLRKDEFIETPIASLIDIVFLLIIFFVVTSAIDKEALDESVRLADSYYVQPQTKRDPRTVTVNLRRLSDRKIELNIGKVPISLSTLQSVLTKAAGTYGHDLPVVVRADQDIHFQDVDRVMATVAKAGLSKIKFSARDKGQR